MTMSPVLLEILNSQRKALQTKVNRRAKSLEEARAALVALEKELQSHR